jgi:hypothetical protein
MRHRSATVLAALLAAIAAGAVAAPASASDDSPVIQPLVECLTPDAQRLLGDGHVHRSEPAGRGRIHPGG